MRRGCAAVFSARFAGRTEERPLAVFVCAKMSEGVCFSSVFFGLEGGGKKKTATEKFFSYRGKNAESGKREYMASSDGLAEADK